MAKSTTTTKKSATVTPIKALALEVSMTLERETKNTFVYKAEGDVAVKALYIEQSHMPAGAPSKITVRIG